jgi:hypothetical protein
VIASVIPSSLVVMGGFLFPVAWKKCGQQRVRAQWRLRHSRDPSKGILRGGNPSKIWSVKTQSCRENNRSRSAPQSIVQQKHEPTRLYQTKLIIPKGEHWQKGQKESNHKRWISVCCWNELIVNNSSNSWNKHDEWKRWSHWW